MSNQEMQFADPDWRPSQKLDAKTGAQEQETFIPEPINADSREQSQWRAMPPPPPQQEMYTGLPPYAGTAPGQMQGGQYRQRQYRRSGRGPWLWIIIALILISLMGGGFVNRGFDPGFGRMGQPHSSSVIDPAQNFTVNGTPTVVINGDSGVITVQTSPDASSVIVQDTKNAGPFGDANDLQVNYNPQGNTIKVNVQGGGQGSVDFTVTVPQDANLQLNTNSGDITIDGVGGQVTLRTDSGNVTATDDTFNGTSTIITNSGDINLTVPADSAFLLNASTNSGSIITSDFPSVKQNQGGTQATGDVGTILQGNSASVTLTTNSGDINVHQG